MVAGGAIQSPALLQRSGLRRNVGRLRSLIEDLLTLSQVESDAFRTTFDLVDLGHLASDVAHAFQDVTGVGVVDG